MHVVGAERGGGPDEVQPHFRRLRISIQSARQNRRERGMTERLGIGIIPGAGWRAAEIRAIAREAEEAGFDAIFTAEVNSDAIATTQLMAEATRRIKVGT